MRRPGTRSVRVSRCVATGGISGGVTDSRIDLQQPVLDGGIRSINFFNGRLLSARDLTREQTATREADRRLGQAVGDGIAYGLEVSKTPGAGNDSPAVSVEAGLAINRNGPTLMLASR